MKENLISHMQLYFAYHILLGRISFFFTQNWLFILQGGSTIPLTSGKTCNFHSGVLFFIGIKHIM